MRTKIQRWGNSLGLRIPKAFAAEARVTDGSIVDVSVEDGELIVRAASPEYDLDVLLRQVRPDNLHDAVEWGEPVGREAW